jgi:hypothetical protein
VQAIKAIADLVGASSIAEIWLLLTATCVTLGDQQCLRIFPLDSHSSVDVELPGLYPSQEGLPFFPRETNHSVASVSICDEHSCVDASHTHAIIAAFGAVGALLILDSIDLNE